jgi:putative selenate reductase YgfK subunit
MQGTQFMTENVCPVARTIDTLLEIISSGRLKHARCRQRAEEILRLMEDVASGRAGAEHIPAMTSVARSLSVEGPDDVCRDTGSMLLSVLEEHREIFQSHLDTQICPVTDCARLIPSPCQMACPAGIDVPSYVTLIGQGRDAEAIELIRKDNPFPWVCGLVCTNPCELMCVRGRIDRPVSIKYLKAFAAERAMSDRLYRNPEKAPDNNKKVCIIGAGPAGLTAAYYLVLKGYGVTVIDSLPMAGGMMMVGIPRYRLPREVIDREVAMIEELGVEFRLNTRFGRDVTLEQLTGEGFEAFLIAVGAHTSYKTRIPGEDDFPQVIDAIDFLRRSALGDRHMPGKRVAVIGGGNVAMDAARSSIRLGCHEVYVIYRRTMAEMPANPEEVHQAEEEGVQFSFLTVPVEIKGSHGMVTSLHCLRTELGPEDKSGRRRPVPIEGSDYFLEVDAVIPAIGQRVDRDGFDELDDLKWSRRDTIGVNTVSMETSVEGIFAAGDAVSGPATVVEAIGGGKRAAEAIDRYLSGIPRPSMPPVPVRRLRTEFIEVPASTKMSITRPRMPMLNDERRRVTFQQVELGYLENSVREEARRCLRCDVCIRCGTCVEICRDKMGIDALKMGYLDFDHPELTDFRVTAERCILCGACAANCPTRAIRMEDRGDERLLNLCGTILNRLKVEYCEICGAVIGPKRYHDYIIRRIEQISQHLEDRVLCLECARKTAAENHVEMTPPKILA